MLPKNGIDAISGRVRSAGRTAMPSSPLCRLPGMWPPASTVPPGPADGQAEAELADGGRQAGVPCGTFGQVGPLLVAERSVRRGPS